jgi:hypothetical protein
MCVQLHALPWGEDQPILLCPQLSVVSDFYARKFDSMCRKYVQHLYLQINLFKN